MNDSIGLSEFVAQVKRELLEKPDDGSTPPVLMVDSVDVELNVVTSRDARGGIKIQVLAASGEVGAGVKRDDMHKVRVTLTPIESHAARLEALRAGPTWDAIHAAQSALNKDATHENQRNQ